MRQTSGAKKDRLYV